MMARALFWLFLFTRVPARAAQYIECYSVCYTSAEECFCIRVLCTLVLAEVMVSYAWHRRQWPAVPQSRPTD